MDQKSNVSNIKVFCRFRPFNKQQLQNKAQKIHRIALGKQLIIKDPNRTQQISFMFDNVFDCDSTQDQVYQNVGLPVLSNILDGFNGTIMAYGQTSSGKTHTMQGHDINDKDIKGLIPRIIENLFTAIEKSPQNLQFKLKVSIFELYMEKIRDLLDVSKNDLKIRQNKHSGPYVEHLTEVYIADKIELYKLIHLGQKNRATCMTNMNALSSRSHMIFLLNLNQTNLQTSQAKTSKLFLIDLAGSQKVSKTGAEGKVLDQAKKINLSLTSLGMVIKSLSQNNAHIPYRDSKLTRIIKDSLGGNAKTTLIVTCSPHEIHVSETISTLRFGENAQKIKNKPKINRELTVGELQKIIEELQAKIQEKSQRIKILENYIKNQLNASLPKYERKVHLDKQKQKQNIQEVHQTARTQPIPIGEQVSKQQMQESSEMGSESDKAVENTIMTITQKVSKQIESLGIQTQNLYNSQQIQILQRQLQQYKQNLQSQLHKFYQLKKQYNSLNQNLKGLIEQNINYQQRQKEYEIRLEEQKQQIRSMFQKNCLLLFGEILDICGQCQLNHKATNTQNVNANNRKGSMEGSGCFGRVKGLIEGKGKVLCMDGEDLQYFDYFKSQKQAINKKMQETIDKSINIQKKLDKRQQSSFQQQKQRQKQRNNQQNKKIVQMQQKLDALYNEYQQMTILQTNWKVQCQLYERKLKIKQQKIVELRNMLQEMQEQMQFMDQENNQTMSVNTKIVKPLKGGFLFK